MRKLLLLLVNLTLSTLALPSYAEFCNFDYSEPIVGEVAVVGQAVDSERERFKVLNPFNGKVVEVGGGSGSLNASLAKSYEEIYERTYLKRGGKFGIGPFKFGKSREFTKTILKKKYAATFMLQFDVKLPNEKFEVDSGTPMTDYARTFLNDPCGFKQVFGDSFVFQTTRGANVYVAINVSFSSAEHLKEYKDKMEGSVEGEFNGLTTTVCTACGAVPIKIPPFKFSASFEQTKEKLSYSALEDGKIELVAMQNGGDASRLGQIFGGQGEVALASCSLKKLANCDSAFNNVLAYLAQEEFVQGVKNQPAVLDYLFRPYWEVDPSIKPVKEVTPAIESVRNQLAQTLLNRETDLSTLKDLLTFSLTAAHRQVLTVLRPKLEQDIEKLLTAGFTCFSDLARCESLSTEALHNLSVYNKSILQLYLEDGLIGHYPFDGNALDTSGHGNNGMAKNTVSYANGKFGQAAQFTGGYIEVPIKDFTFKNQSLTFSVWTTVAHNYKYVYIPFISLGWADGDLIHLGKNRGGILDGGIFIEIHGKGTINNSSLVGTDLLAKYQNDWLHVVGVVDYESGVVKLYLNGQQQGTAELTGNFQVSSQAKLFIGYSVCCTGGDNYYGYQGGFMDDVRIYNRALTDEEIQWTYMDNQPPIAQFTATPLQGKAPLTVTLNANISRDADGSIQSYQWKSSDGQTATGKTGSLTFSKVGTYTIQLTVIDNKGGTSKAAKTIKVQNTYHLTVNKTGDGIGSVTGIGDYLANSSVTLTATAGTGSQFSNWSGDCSGNAKSIKLTMNANKTCTAVFNKVTASTTCIASYQNNLLNIPCLNIVNVFTTQTYQVELQQQPLVMTFIVNLNSLKLKATVKNACAAEYNGTEVHVPCVDDGTGDIRDIYLLQQPNTLLFDLDVNRITKTP